MHQCSKFQVNQPWHYRLDKTWNVKIGENIASDPMNIFLWNSVMEYAIIDFSQNATSRHRIARYDMKNRMMNLNR